LKKESKDVALLSISDTLSTPMLQQNTKSTKKLLVIQRLRLAILKPVFSWAVATKSLSRDPSLPRAIAQLG